MTRIIVDPGDLRNLAGAFRRETANLEAMSGRLNSSVFQLDWRLRARYPVENNWYAARGKLRAICNQGDQLAYYLYYKADRFENADRNGYRGLIENRWFRLLPPQYLMMPPWYVKNLLKIEEEKLKYCVFNLALVSPAAVLFVGLLDSIAEDKETYGHITSLGFEAIKRLRPGISALPFINVAVGTFLDYATGEDHSERGLRVALGKNLIELGIGFTGVGEIVLLANAGVQVGGKAWIHGSEWIGKQYCVEPMHDMMIERSAERTGRALEKLDLGNLTEDLSKIANDTYIEPQINAWRQAWEHPSVGNVAKAFGTGILVANPATAMFAVAMDSDARAMLAQDVKSLAFHTGDFVVGAATIRHELIRHGVTVTGAMATEYAERVLPPSMSEPISRYNDSLLAIINSAGEIPKFEEMLR